MGRVRSKVLILILVTLMAFLVLAIPPNPPNSDTVQGYILKTDGSGINNASIQIYTTSRTVSCSFDSDCCANCTGSQSAYYSASDGSYAISTADLIYPQAVNNCAFGNRVQGQSCEADIDTDVEIIWLEINGSTVIPTPMQDNITGMENWSFYWSDSASAFILNSTLQDIPVPQPNLTVIKTDSPDPVENGTLLNYTILINNTGDGTASNVTLFETYPINVTFVSSTPSANQSNTTWYLGNLTSSSSITVNITVRVNNNATNGVILTNFANVTFENTTSTLSVTDEENTTVFVVDNPPYWSNNQTNIVSTYLSTTQSLFNITWQDDYGVSMVWFESNYSGSAVNYSMNNIIGDVYNYSAILPAGTHYWKSYANDTADQWNTSDQWMFTIAKASSTCNLDVSFSPVTYGTQTQANCSCDNPEAAAILYRNGTDVTATENGTLVTLPVGDWYYVCNTTETQNYTNVPDNNWTNVTKATGTINLYINGSTDDFKQNVSFSANITCSLTTPSSGNITIYEDGTLLNSSIGSTLTHIKTYTTPADYNITCVLENHQNYTASDQSWVNATDEDSLAVTLEYPPANYWNDTSDPFSINFNCSATDNYNLRNISLWITNNQNNSFGLNSSSVIMGISNSSNWTLSLSNGNYTWNCLAYDEYNNSAWGTNRTILINHTVTDSTLPNVTIITPLDTDIFGWTVLLRANATDLNLANVTYEIRNGTISSPVIATGIMNNIGGDIYNSTLVTNATWPYDNTVLNSTNLTLVVYANDTSGNVANDSTYWILDNTQPNIQHVTPTQAGNFFNSNFSLEIWLSNHQLNYSQYNITNSSGTLIQTNSTSLSSATFTWTEDVNVDNLSEGNYTLTTYARDYVGNNNTKTTWFYIDQTPPNVTTVNETGWIPPTPPNNTITNIQTHTFNMTCNETFIDTVWINFNGTINNTPQNSGTSYWWTFTNLGEGSYTYIGHCNDTTGNNASTDTRILTINTSYVTNIEVYLDQPSNDSSHPTGNVNYIYNAYGSDLDTCRLWTNTTGSWLANTSWISVPQGTNNFSNNLTTNGTYIWNVECRGTIGSSVFASANYTLHINDSINDTTDPEVHLFSPPDGLIFPLMDSLTFMYGVIESYSPKCRLWTNLSGDWNISVNWTNVPQGLNNFVDVATPSNGTYIWNVECEDSSGNNAFAPTNYTFTLTSTINDTTPPEVDLKIPDNGSSIPLLWSGLAQPLFGFGVFDDYSFGALCRLWTNMTGDWNITRPWKPSMAGTYFPDVFISSTGSYEWNVECKDGSNNSAFAPANYTFDVENMIYQEPLEVRLGMPMNGSTWYRNFLGADVDFMYAMTGPLTSECRLWTDKTGVWDITIPWKFVGAGLNSFNDVFFGLDGNYTWNVECKNLTGGTKFAEDNFTFELSNFTFNYFPEVDLIQPENASFKPDGEIDFVYNVHDALLNQECRLWTNRSGTWDITRNWVSVPLGVNAFSSVTISSNGEYIWNVECKNTFGNTAFALKNLTLTVDSSISDSEAPEIDLVQPNNFTIKPAGDIDFVYEVNDNYDPDCRLWTNRSGNWTVSRTWETVPVGFNAFSNVPINNNGTYIWNVECRDMSGNSAFSTANYSLLINDSINDDVSPTITLLQPLNLTTKPTSELDFIFNVTDNYDPDCALWTNRTGTWWIDRYWKTFSEGINAFPDVTITTTGNYIWNVQCRDSSGNLAFASENFTVFVNASINDTEQPNVTLWLPLNNSRREPGEVNFTYNVTDNYDPDCRLWTNKTGTWTVTKTWRTIPEGTNSFNGLMFLNLGTYMWNVECKDMSDNRVFAVNNYTFIIASDATNPNLTLISPTDNYWNDSSDPFNITFECNATDDVGLTNISLYITNSTNQSFSFNQTTSISGISNSSSWLLSLANGNYTWNCLAYDTSSNSDWGDSNRSLEVNYTAPVVDNPPYWSNNQTSIVTTYSSTTQSLFNITWQDDNGVNIVWFESNYSGTPTNYSMNNISGDVYNYSTILPAGTHYWKSYANDTADQWNQSNQWTFNIAKAAGTINLYINGSTNDFRQNVSFSANITCGLTTPSSGNITIYEDGVMLNSSISSTLTHIKTYTTPADYNITCILENHQNYTASDQSWVNATDEDSLAVTLEYPPVNYWNDTSDPFSINFNCSATDNYNLRNISLYITNNQNTSFGLNSSSIITGISNSSNWTVSLANGNYTWNCLAYDQQNNSAWGNNRTILINYTALPVDNPPYWSNNQTSIVTTYSSTTQSLFNITWQDDHGVSIVWFESNYSGTPTNYSMNNISGTVTNGIYNYSAILPAGTHYWKSYANDTADQWNKTYMWNFTINKANSLVNLTLNNSQSNITIQNGTAIDLNCSLITGEGNIYLYNNGTLINSGSSPLGNLTTFNSVGLYNITCLYNETQNYSSSTETYWVNASIFDNPPNVTLSLPADSYSQTTSVPVNITFECNATDDNQLQNISLWITNPSNINFTLNQTTNISGISNSTNWTLTLALGTYTWNCLADDNASQTDWGDNNRSLTLSAPAPSSSSSSSGGGSSSSGGGGGGCIANCEGKVCGSDGCGGSCGECSEGETCSSGFCIKVPECGDGILASGEECDDGNNDNGDGCSASCKIEEELKDIDLIIIDYPQSMDVEDDLTIKVKITNTGDAELNDLVLSSDVNEGWSMPQDIYISSIAAGETKEFNVNLNNEVCSSEGEIIIPQKIEFNAKVEGDGVKDADEASIDISIKEGLSMSTDKKVYTAGESMGLCLIIHYDDKGLDSAEVDIVTKSLEDDEYQFLDHIYSFKYNIKETLAIKKNIKIKNIMKSGDYEVSAKLLNSLTPVDEEKVTVEIIGFIEKQILGEASTSHEVLGHTLTINNFDDTFAYVTWQSDPTDYTLKLLEVQDIEMEEEEFKDRVTMIYINKDETDPLNPKADIRIRLDQKVEEGKLPIYGLASAYQIIGLDRITKATGLQKGSLFPVIIMWVVIILIIASIMILSSWAHHHWTHEGGLRRKKKENDKLFKKKKKR
ncbi:MAG: DUF11 domain-containing protein [Nanoarchaeota archaeon]|nr:DUF11 domain-containing protein [Nanoarchaeota archaeon]